MNINTCERITPFIFVAKHAVSLTYVPSFQKILDDLLYLQFLPKDLNILKVAEQGFNTLG